MLNHEKLPVTPHGVLRTAIGQIHKNKTDYREHYSKDWWPVDNSPIASYEKFFSPVTTGADGMNIVNFIRSRPSPVVLDLMSHSDALVDLFKDIKEEPRLGLAVSLLDKRSDDRKRKDSDLGIRLVSGDILRSGTWHKIEKELDGKKADLIIERAVGGLNFLSGDKNVVAALMEKAWGLLSEQQGMLLIQTPSGFNPEVEYFEDQMDSAARIISNWLEYLSERKIEGVYSPYIWSDCGYSGALKIIKFPDSPKNLPFPSWEFLNKLPSPSKEGEARIKADKKSIESILKWCDENK